jgi:hypothetical protein
MEMTRLTETVEGSFLIGDRKFSAPMMRPAHGNVRDHIDSLKTIGCGKAALTIVF